MFWELTVRGSILWGDITQNSMRENSSKVMLNSQLTFQHVEILNWHSFVSSVLYSNPFQQVTNIWTGMQLTLHSNSRQKPKTSANWAYILNICSLCEHIPVRPRPAGSDSCLQTSSKVFKFSKFCMTLLRLSSSTRAGEKRQIVKN